MRYGLIMEFDNDAVSLDKYWEVSEAIGTHGSLPKGCLSHAVGQTAEHGFRVIEVWESKQEADTFSSVLVPALHDAQVPPPCRVSSFEVDRFATAETASATNEPLS